MLAGERELYQRFVRYDDEVLLRILTVERAKYRPEALSAAELVLMHRGAATPPLLHPISEPSAPHATGRPQRSYTFLDLCVDVLLVLLAVWGWKKLWVWTEAPFWVWPLGSIAYWGLTYGFLCSVFSLRQKWRSK